MFSRIQFNSIQLYSLYNAANVRKIVANKIWNAINAGKCNKYREQKKQKYTIVEAMPKMLTEESFELEIPQSIKISTDADEDVLQLSVENFVMKRGRNDEIEV